MKLIDFALYFSLFFLCAITMDNIKNELLYKNTMDNIMYNDCMDEIIIDSLKTSFYKVDEQGKPVIDKKVLINCYKGEISLLKADTNIIKEYSDDYSVLILTEADGFYIYYNSSWSEKILYEPYSVEPEAIENLENIEIKHEEKVLQIETILEERFNIRLLLALNSGEKFKNSISDYSLLAIYRRNTMNIDGESYGIYSLSGAAVLEN